MLAWQQRDPEEVLEQLWKRVAYATRYGRIGLEEAMGLDQHALGAFLQALSEIVADENKQGGGALGER